MARTSRARCVTLVAGLYVLGGTWLTTRELAAQAAVGRPQSAHNVTGVVRDSAGQPISNVQVVVSSLHRVTLTDDRGDFFFRALPPGTYHLDLVRLGFAAEHRVVTVTETGGDVRMAVTMKVATVRLSSVNVTATPTGADPLDVTQATVQLSGKELQRTISTSIGQTLANEPGMAARFNGPVASAPVIRGLTGERVLILQDGDRTGDLASASPDHMNAVDPSSAERIEVIRGPASLLYGNNAIGGVVNVISNDIPTTIPSRPSGYASMQTESVTPGATGAAGVTLPVGAHLALTARGGIRRFSDMRVGGGAVQDNTNGHTANATLGGGYVGANGSVGLVYREMSFNYGLPHPVDEDPIRIDGARHMLALQSSRTLGTGMIGTLKADATAQWYTHRELEATGAVGTTFALQTQTANVLATTQAGRVTGSVGVQGIRRRYTPAGEEAFTPGAANTGLAAFVYQEVPLVASRTGDHAPSLQLGLRYDHFTVESRPSDAEGVARFGAGRTITFDNVASSAGVSLPVAHDVALLANVSRGFRAPTVEELFANGYHAAVGTYDQGSASLRAEQSTGMELGIRAQTSHTYAQGTAYYNLIDRYIRPVTVGIRKVDGLPVPLTQYQQADAVLAGVEGQVETKLPHHFVGGVMGDLTRARLRASGDPLPFIPAGRLGGSLRYDDGATSVGGEVRRVFAQDRVSGDLLDVATGAYTLVNLNATRMFTVSKRGVHAITLRIDNVLDAQYRDATSRIKSYAFNPGRNLSLVYKIVF